MIGPNLSFIPIRSIKAGPPNIFDVLARLKSNISSSKTAKLDSPGLPVIFGIAAATYLARASDAS